MRVVFVPHAYSPSIGGAEGYTRGLAEELATHRHEVHVVVADVVNPEAFYELGHAAVGMAEETIAEVQVHRLPFHSFSYRRPNALIGSEKAIESARSRFREHLGPVLASLQPDVVITLPHLFPNVEDVVGLRSSAAWKLVYAPMLHEDDPYWSIERVSEAVVASDGVIALTDYERSRLIASYGARESAVATVPPGVDVAIVHRDEERDEVVLFVGRRTPSKRLDVLYEAMKTVWVDHPSARLTIAGSAPTRGLDPAAFMAADQRVTVTTSPSDAERDQLLASARLVVSPSSTESFGIAILEAWAHETPVVLVDSPVNRSVIRHDVDGVIAASLEADDLAAAIGQLLGDPDLAMSMGRAGRQRVESEFTWSNAAQSLQQLLETL